MIRELAGAQLLIRLAPRIPFVSSYLAASNRSPLELFILFRVLRVACDRASVELSWLAPLERSRSNHRNEGVLTRDLCQRQLRAPVIYDCTMPSAR